METAINIMMDMALKRAQKQLESGVAAPGFFICEGTHGNTLFNFSSPEDFEDQYYLCARMRFTCLCYNVTESVTVQSGTFPADLRQWRVFDQEDLDAWQGKEMLVIVGENRTEWISKAFPVLRDDSGRFVGLGVPWEKLLPKQLGEDHWFVAGTESAKQGRLAGLEIARKYESYMEQKRVKKLEAGQGKAQSP